MANPLDYVEMQGVANVTPSDTVYLTNSSRQIRVTVAGNVKVTTVNGSVATCAFAAGEIRNIRATLIWSTGTTATGIEVMW